MNHMIWPITHSPAPHCVRKNTQCIFNSWSPYQNQISARRVKQRKTLFLVLIMQGPDCILVTWSMRPLCKIKSSGSSRGRTEVGSCRCTYVLMCCMHAADSLPFSTSSVHRSTAAAPRSSTAWLRIMSTIATRKMTCVWVHLLWLFLILRR